MIKETLHQFIAGTAQDMSVIESCSVDLVVTSPPYPMIEMWDEIFSLQNPKIKYALQENNGFLALNDDSHPEEIKSVLKMSKKSFKKAIGSLYKQKLISIKENGIQLN